jgi:hypothetical protein
MIDQTHPFALLDRHRGVRHLAGVAAQALHPTQTLS